VNVVFRQARHLFWAGIGSGVATITGSMTDPSDAALVSARVDVRLMATRSVVSSSQIVGLYLMLPLEPVAPIEVLVLVQLERKRALRVVTTLSIVLSAH